MTFEDLLNDEPYKSCYEKGFSDGYKTGRRDAWNCVDKLINNITNPIETMKKIIEVWKKYD